jgi:hypothetical protein
MARQIDVRRRAEQVTEQVRVTYFLVRDELLAKGAELDTITKETKELQKEHDALLEAAIALGLSLHEDDSGLTSA